MTAHVADALNYAHSLKVVHQLDKGDITSNKNGRQEAFGNPVNRFVL